MPLTKFLEKNARYHGRDIALVEINPDLEQSRQVTWKESSLIETTQKHGYRNEMSWAEFDEKANQFANLLLTRGVKKGDKVAILLMNCLEWLPVYFGILKAGALAVPLNYRYAADEIKYCLEKSDSSILVFGPEFTERIETIKDSIPAVRFKFFVGKDCPDFAESYNRLTTYCSNRAPDVYVTDEDDGAIYFSSGTTGFPKAILLSHEALVHAARTEQAHHGQTRDDVFLCIPPLYHTGAKMHWMGSLLVGAKSVILKGTRPDWIIKAVSSEQCTIVWLLVPWAQDILDSIERGDIDLSNYDLEQWRLMHIGAQPVPPSLIRRWKKHFPNHEYDTNYGLSEATGPGCVHLGLGNIDKVGAIGIPGFGWEVRIADPQGNDVPRGQVGELLIKGPGVMRCYYNDPESTAETLRDGWLSTGDMAEMEEDGFIYLVDRKKDVIITGGENLYPVQIEDFIRSHDAVRDVAVIGLPDSRLGGIAAAIIEVKPGFELSEEQVNEFCLELPRYKRPRKVIFAPIPRNPTGKIEKPKLRVMYGADRIVAKETEKN
ncbi:MAG: acyl--CoA ligase [Oscillospiraceae bacterium]|nr:acyl--CoA ligase [Oscillospiraceae bacterium]